jgi:hypothetical protein
MYAELATFLILVSERMKYLLTVLLCFGAVNVFAEDLSGFDRGIASVYRAVETAIKKGDSEAVYKKLYREGAVVAAEGAPQVARDKKSLMAIIDDVLKSTRDCVIAPDSAREVSGKLAYSFVTYKCVPVGSRERNLIYRGVYIWSNDGKDWRVLGEIFGSGSM